MSYSIEKHTRLRPKPEPTFGKKPYKGKDKNRKGNKKKTSKCKICKESFVPIRQLQPTCEKMKCMIEYSNRHLDKLGKEKKQQARRELIAFNNSDIKILKRRCQKKVNEYVRLRDRNLGCISCGTMRAKYDAGHYRPATNSELRYNTINIRKQCFKCNRILAANLKYYRENLVKLIGEGKVTQLDNTNGMKKFDVEYLTRLLEIFTRKIHFIKEKMIQ